MKLERRSVFGWGATAAGYAACDRGLVIHYDGSNQGLANKPHSACRTYWKNTRRFHMGPSRRWSDIGYSWGCCPHGIILEGRGARRQQAAQPGGNTTYTSCTLMSGPGENPTPEQIEGVRQLRAWLRKNYGLGKSVKGHRNFVSTSCPGDKAYALVTNGTFTKAPGATITITGGNPLLGLKKGDEGEAVGALQQTLVYCGADLKVDDDYGPKTAAALLWVRKQMGSSATNGNKVTDYAYAQILAQLARTQARKVSGGGGSGGPVPKDLVVDSLTAKTLKVG